MAPYIVGGFVKALPGALQASERLHLERVMSGAESLITVVGETTTSPGNHAGRLLVSRARDALRGKDVHFVTKGVQGDAEVAASKLASHMGLDHVIPIAVTDGKHGARMLFAPGLSADVAGIHTTSDLIALRARGVRQSNPEITPAKAQQIAQVEVELTQVFDYILANGDRRPRNLIVDLQSGRFSFIDNASIGHGTLGASSPIRPVLRPAYQGPGGRTPLSADTVDWIRSHLDEDTLRAWHEASGEAVRGPVDGYIERLRQVLDQGEFSYTDSAALAASNRMHSSAGFKVGTLAPS